MIDVGQTVGNYQVKSLLGEGGMGIVYLAEHPVIGRKAALKVIHPEFARNAEVVSRFVTEAKAVNQIGHEHIVDITDFGTTPAGDFYFIMEYLQGESLAHWIRRGARLDLPRALLIAKQLTSALQASHDHGVIHRDLKPDNIILVSRGDDDAFVKVLDFGLAKLIGPGDPAPHNTRAGSVVGTPYYMAPEQCEGKVDIDHRADIYALGVILFEMLTGKVPFGGTGYGEIIVKHMTVPAPSPRSLVPDLPPALDAILLRALAKDPAHRFQSMAELGAALAEPDGYAAATPSLGIHDDLSGRMRTALPMARSEIKLRRTPMTLVEGQRVPSLAPSTFREGVGEIASEEPGDDVIPRIPYGRRLSLAALAGAGLVVFATSAYKPPMARVVAAANLWSRPATVRLSFTSEPLGASVARADGVALGVTPLSTEASYGDAPVSFVVSKPGFIAKTIAVVPNAPAPVFAVLDAEAKADTAEEELPDPPVDGAEDVGAPLSLAAEPHKTHASARHRDRERTATFTPRLDEDGTLAPTFSQ